MAGIQGVVERLEYTRVCLSGW